MNAIGTTSPDSDPALERMLVEARDRLSAGPIRRGRVIDRAVAAAFVLAAVAIALGFDSGRSLDPALAPALVITYAVAARIEFAMGSGWAVPTQLVFVPMLFVLPTQLVPLLVALALLGSRLPEYSRRSMHPAHAVPRIAEASYTVWPTLFLCLTGATDPVLSDWPLFVAALAIQFGCDLALTVARETAAIGVRVAPLLRELRAVYLVDALLSPIGFLAALAAVGEPAVCLLVIPLLGLIAVFSHEREARIENALTLSAAYRGTALLLGEVLSTNDEYTGAHSHSVVVLAHQVAEQLELEERTVRDVEFGALLHDVGKISVPNEILNKPAKLDPDEIEIMRRHTQEGERMLERIGGVLGEVGEVVRTHHENFDGSGYPHGLAGEEIPLAARVISCCDAFNAMTTDRPYRKAMAVEDAIAELRANAGRQFDPRVVEALIAVAASWEESDPPGPQDG